MGSAGLCLWYWSISWYWHISGCCCTTLQEHCQTLHSPPPLWKSVKAAEQKQEGAAVGPEEHRWTAKIGGWGRWGHSSAPGLPEPREPRGGWPGLRSGRVPVLQRRSAAGRSADLQRSKGPTCLPVCWWLGQLQAVRAAHCVAGNSWTFLGAAGAG